MADDAPGGFNDFGGSTELFQDNPGTGGSAPERREDPPDPAAAGAAGPPQDGSTGQEQVPAELAGLPFKTTKDLVDGYKNLQRNLSSRDTSYKKLEGQVQELVRQLTGQLRGQPAEKVSPESADAFLKRFLVDPSGTLAATVKELASSMIREQVDPIRGELSSGKVDRMVQNFLSTDAKTLTTEEQDRFLALMEENPWVNQAPDPLKITMQLLIADNPEMYAQRRRDAKEKAGKGLQDAKAGAAGLGGKRTSTQMAGSGAKDEFDAVLERHKGAVMRP